uniref:Toll/interleukin-1 receptor (TIR) domain-containing protein n=1 Tax=Tanacetum cinerariifolium TaxID=118510 RepID=A0A699S1M1_TANCI|nr:Toll/interleukin-1 receptor (TIR) domain-containing protein [Tanacetum cinerariifolium]
MENLVALDMSYSNIEFFDMSCSNHQRAEKRQELLGSLKILDLSFSEQLRGVGPYLQSCQWRIWLLLTCLTAIPNSLICLVVATNELRRGKSCLDR